MTLDLLTYSDLEALRDRRNGMTTTTTFGPPVKKPSSAPCPQHSHSQGKRYLILTYSVEFDRLDSNSVIFSFEKSNLISYATFTPLSWQNSLSIGVVICWSSYLSSTQGHHLQAGYWTWKIQEKSEHNFNLFNFWFYCLLSYRIIWGKVVKLSPNYKKS